MHSFRDIIDAYTAKSLANILGVTESHVRVMRARDSIPPEYWPALISNASDELKASVTYERLLAMRKAAMGRKPDSAA